MAWWVDSVVVGLILVLDATRQVVIQAPAWWTQLLTPAVSLLGIVAAYFLGRQQGRAQTRHDKSVDVAVEVLRKSLLFAQDIKYWAESAPYDGLPQKDLDAADDLKAYFEANAPWLEPELIRKIGPIVEGFVDVSDVISLRKLAQSHAEGKGKDEVEHADRRAKDYADQVKAWFADEADQLLEDLKDEIRRLIGTKPMRP